MTGAMTHIPDAPTRRSVLKAVVGTSGLLAVSPGVGTVGARGRNDVGFVHDDDFHRNGWFHITGEATGSAPDLNCPAGNPPRQLHGYNIEYHDEDHGENNPFDTGTFWTGNADLPTDHDPDRNYNWTIGAQKCSQSSDFWRSPFVDIGSPP